MKKNSSDESANLEVFRSAPVGQAVLKNAIPAMAAMLMVLVSDCSPGQAPEVPLMTFSFQPYTFVSFGTKPPVRAAS